MISVSAVGAAVASPTATMLSGLITIFVPACMIGAVASSVLNALNVYATSTGFVSIEKLYGAAPSSGTRYALSLIVAAALFTITAFVV